MKGSKKVIDQLNFLLIGELTSADLYLLHSNLYHDWGFTKLHERIAHEMQDEINHSNQLIERINFLEGSADVSKRDEFEVLDNVEDMLKQSLKFEYDVAANLKKAIKICEEENDFVSRDILLVLLSDTENDHINWLEIQLKLIKTLGLGNYLQTVS
jgi:bacterioferritin